MKRALHLLLIGCFMLPACTSARLSHDEVRKKIAEIGQSNLIPDAIEVRRIISQSDTSAIAEAAVFGARLGADPQVVLDLIGTSFGGSTMMTRNLPRFMSRDFSPATPVGLILKDLGLIHDEAKAAQVPLLLGGLAEQRFLEARARGMGDEDMAALVKLWEEPAGVTVNSK